MNPKSFSLEENFQAFLKEKAGYETILIELIDQSLDSFKKEQDSLNKQRAQVHLLGKLLSQKDRVIMQIVSWNKSQKELMSDFFPENHYDELKEISRFYSISPQYIEVNGKFAELLSQLYDEMKKNNEHAREDKKRIEQKISVLRSVRSKMMSKKLYSLTEEEQKVVTEISESKIDCEEFFKDLAIYYQYDQERKDLLIAQQKQAEMETMEQQSVSVEELLPNSEYEQDVYHQDQELYWDHVKSLESLTHLNDVLPQESAKYYAQIMSYILEKLESEIEEYQVFAQASSGEDLEDMENQIGFYQNIQREVQERLLRYYEIPEEELIQKEAHVKNKIIFVERPSGGDYLTADLKEFDRENRERVIKLLDQLANDSYPRDMEHFRRFVNSDKVTIFPVYELKKFQTRLLFTYLGSHHIAVFMALIKKADKSTSILNRIENRIKDILPQINSLKKQVSENMLSENYLKEQEQRLDEHLTK